MAHKQPTLVQAPRKASTEALVSLAKTLQKDRDTLGVLRQVTAQLKQEHALLLSVLQHLPCGVVIASAPSGRLITGNHVMDDILGHPLESVKNMLNYRDWKVFHADGRPFEGDEWPMARAILYGEVVVGEIFKIQRADGSYRYVITNAAPLRDHKGQTVAGMLAMMEIPRPPVGRRLMNRKKRLIEHKRRVA
jgi:PAS domain-containing protein